MVVRAHHSSQYNEHVRKASHKSTMSGKLRIAVIGAGPAGLAAVQQLKEIGKKGMFM